MVDEESGIRSRTMTFDERFAEVSNLQRAWKAVKSSGGAPGVDGISVEQFQLECLESIRKQLLSGNYAFCKLRVAEIPKPQGGSRRLCIPTVKDRVVLQSIRYVIEPLCERHFLPCSHAYRCGQGALTALQQIVQGLQAGFDYILESDIQAFFDSIRHSDMLASLGKIDRQLSQNRLLRSSLKMSPGWWPARKGIAQGSPLSPLLANVALIEFDRQLTQAKYRLVRYADDFVLLCQNESHCLEGRKLAEEGLKKIGLQLHPNKTRVVNSRRESFSFLGFELHPDRIVPTASNLAELRSGLLAWCNPHQQIGWPERIERINGLLRSFAWYYHQTDSRRIFWSLDQFVREQLEELERTQGEVNDQWRSQLVSMSGLREVTWKGKGKPKGRGWNGYGLSPNRPAPNRPAE
jgi:group II intron reverse transcriptase/maturase